MTATRRGFTLVECLIGLALSLLIITAGVEFYARAERVFRRLKTREEAGQAVLAAIDRMRIDLLHAGRDLAPEIGLGLAAAAGTVGAELRLAWLEKALTLSADAAAGSTRIAVASTSGVTAGQRIVLRQGPSGEARTVVRVEAGGLVLDAPLDGSYAAVSAALALIEDVAYVLDGAAGILRRRANGGSAQPVLEDTAAAAWTIDPAAPLVRVRIQPATEGVPAHETTVFLKNAALAGKFGT